MNIQKKLAPFSLFNARAVYLDEAPKAAEIAVKKPGDTPDLSGKIDGAAAKVAEQEVKMGADAQKDTAFGSLVSGFSAKFEGLKGVFTAAKETLVRHVTEKKDMVQKTLQTLSQGVSEDSVKFDQENKALVSDIMKQFDPTGSGAVTLDQAFVRAEFPADKQHDAHLAFSHYGDQGFLASLEAMSPLDRFNTIKADNVAFKNFREALTVADTKEAAAAEFQKDNVAISNGLLQQFAILHYADRDMMFREIFGTSGLSDDQRASTYEVWTKNLDGQSNDEGPISKRHDQLKGDHDLLVAFRDALKGVEPGDDGSLERPTPPIELVGPPAPEAPVVQADAGPIEPSKKPRVAVAKKKAPTPVIAAEASGDGGRPGARKVEDLSGGSFQSGEARGKAYQERLEATKQVDILRVEAGAKRDQVQILGTKLSTMVDDSVQKKSAADPNVREQLATLRTQYDNAKKLDNDARSALVAAKENLNRAVAKEDALKGSGSQVARTTE